MTRRRWLLATFSGLVLLLTVLAGCSNQTVRDLEGIPVQDPEKSEIYVNVDRFPNIVVMCIHGVGFATTTRDNSPAAVQHIPSWDAANDGWCGK